MTGRPSNPMKPDTNDSEMMHQQETQGGSSKKGQPKRKVHGKACSGNETLQQHLIASPKMILPSL